MTPAAADAVRIVAVVGAGTMGAGIAQVAAQAGYDVQLHDASAAALDRARAAIARSLAKFVEKQTITADDRDRTLARIATPPSLDAAAKADLVIEAIVEDREAKVALFATLDRIAQPHAVLASNTSSIPIRQLAAATTRPGQVAGMHFMNPVPLMPLVELIRAESTSTETMAKLHAVTVALGKVGVEAADAPGFIANRVLMPMINEAAFALAEGVGTAEAIDRVMVLGMRHPMGPLALADLIGIDVCVAILNVLEDGLKNPKYAACPLLRQMVADRKLGRKTGQGFYQY